MQKDEAIMILSRHLMQCGMMMPIEWVQNNGEGSEFMQAFEMAMDALKNEVVRCKDCKSWKQYNACDGTKPHRCMNHNAIFYKRTAPDDFCSYGERRTNGSVHI